MSFFRGPSLFRADPFFSSPSPFPLSAFPVSPFSPFSPLSSASLFDPFPVTPVSAPLYTLLELRDDDGARGNNRRRHPSPSSPHQSTGHAQLTKEDRSPANNNSAISGASQSVNDSGKSTTPQCPSTTSTTSTTSPRQVKSNNRAMTTTGPSRSSLFAPLPSLFSSALSPLTSLPSMDMTIDMFSTPTAYSIHASVPGVDKGDIKLTMDDNQLTIEAERRERRVNKPTNNTVTDSSSSTPTSTPQLNVDLDNKQGDEELKHDPEDVKATTATTTSDAPMSVGSTSSSTSSHDSDDVTYHHVESFYGKVSRRVQLPEDAKVDELTAKYEDGMIKITVPRQQEQRKRERRIELQ